MNLEPMLFLKMVAEGNVTVIAETLQLDRSCRVNLNFTEEDCMAMDDGNHSDVQVIKKKEGNRKFYDQIILIRKPSKSTKTISIIIKD